MHTVLDNELTFINWEGRFQYGPAIVVDGLYEASEIVDSSTKSKWQDQLSDDILARYYDKANSACTNFRRCAYAILNVDMPFTDFQFGTVGDMMNLFPIT
jgi:hypothetical protein